jgi:hypothetical protein
MIQYVCDRCGKVVTAELFRVQAAEFKFETVNVLHTKPEICRECVNALEQWLKPLPKGERARDEK